jgi:hypothetical protein
VLKNWKMARIKKRHHIPKMRVSMKVRSDFTLYCRLHPSGKRVFYYYVYDENGKRSPGRSTGQTTKTAARLVCNKLLKEAQAVTRHKSDTMTERYNHFDPGEFVKVKQVQDALLEPIQEKPQEQIKEVVLSDVTKTPLVIWKNCVVE